MREIGYAMAYSFKYSPRPGTLAADMDRQIAPGLMDERLQALQALLNEQQHAFNQATLGVSLRCSSNATASEARSSANRPGSSR